MKETPTPFLVRLYKKELKEAKSLALKKHVSVAQIIREALTLYLR